MNTPAHLVVNLAVLSRVAPASARRWIVAGALLPDLPMLVFYVWQRGMLVTSEGHIWDHAYFEPAWQSFFDVFNSVPVFAVAAVAAALWRRSGPAWGCTSVLLHVLGDAFLHREDGHRHLWPLSDARFHSTVSYWDPAHHGFFGAGLETLLVLASAWVLWGDAKRTSRVALGLLCALSLSTWVAFYGLGYAPAP